MKRFIMTIVLLLTLIFPLKAYASTTTVEIGINGKIENGQEVSIVVDMKGLEGLYAASLDFEYDKNTLKILSITPGDSIKKYEDEIMEIGGEVDEDNNKTSYSFTFLGDKKGIYGDATLAVIKVKILNDEKLEIGQDSVKVKLVKRVDDSVDNYDYNFKGVSVGVDKPNVIETPSNSISKNESTTKPNEEDIEDSNNSISNDSDNKLENNNDNNQDNDESKLSDSSEDDTKHENEVLESDKNNSKILNQSSPIFFYIAIPALIIIVGYCYYKFKISKES